MKKRFLTTMMACTLALTACFGLVGCGKDNDGGNNDDKTLQIYIGNFGYGVEWLEKCAEEFPKQQWVIDKYGEINVPKPTNNSDKGYSERLILSGAVANEFDIMFSTASSNASVFNKDSSGNPYFEDLTSLLDETVPGETVTLKQKMKADILESEMIVDKAELKNADAQKHLMGMPWVDGTMGLLYNETLIKQELGANFTGLPRTTKELVEFSQQLKDSQASKAKADKIAVYIFSSLNGYWDSMYQIWWAQYEGVDGYHNYWNGLDESGRIGNEIFKQRGRLYGLEALQSIIGIEKGFNHDEVNSMSFMQSQAKFIVREGFMSPNGDWVENEMRTVADENPNDDTVKFMKAPVVSQIVEKLDLYTDGTTYYDDLSPEKQNAYDDKLSAIVQAIDEGKDYATAKTTITDLTEKDYNKVYEARYVTSRLEGHNAYIPYYATAKGLAKDFLRFLATDTAISTFMTTTNGCSTAYEFDASKLGFALPAMHQSRWDMSKTGYRLAPSATFPLQYYGGLRPFNASTGIIELYFSASNEGDRKTPQTIYEADLNLSSWSQILTNSGI